MTTRQGDFSKPEKLLFYTARTKGYKAGDKIKGIDRYLEMSGDFVIAFHRIMPHANAPTRFKRILGQLESLLAYNVQDTINLEHLLVSAYNMKAGQTPFAVARRVPEVVLPTNPFGVDVRMAQEIQRGFLRGPW